MSTSNKAGKQKQEAHKASLPARDGSEAITIRANATNTPTSSYPTTPSSFLSKSMSNSMKHEIFDLGARYGHGTPCSLIVSTQGQGFAWNRDVFLRDEWMFDSFARQAQSDDNIEIHEIHLDDEVMFE